MSKYQELSEKVVGLLGGKENVSLFTYCATRLRFNVKNKSLVDEKAISKLSGVIGTSWAGPQLQLIIGPAVGDAYEEIVKANGFERAEQVDENLDPEIKDNSFKGIVMRVLDYVTGSLTPMIPILVGCGMIKTLITVLTNAHVLDSSSPTLQVLTWIGDAGFYFFPIYVGKNAAKKLGASEALGMALGAILIHPTFVNGVAAGTKFSIFGLPIYAANYKSTIFPILLSVAAMAPIQKFIGKHSPNALRSLLEPTLTIMIMAPLSLCLLAPLGGYLGKYVAEIVIWTYNTFGFIGVGLFAALFPIIVMMGMHTALIPYLVQMLSTVGHEAIYVVASFISNFNQGAACLAVALKSKDENQKSTAFSCGVTAILGGISEPAFFGVNLKLKTPFMAVLAGNLCAGLLAGLLKVYCYSMPGSGSVFGLPAFIGPTASNLLLYIVCLAVGMVITFVVTMIIYKPEEN